MTVCALYCTLNILSCVCSCGEKECPGWETKLLPLYYSNFFGHQQWAHFNPIIYTYRKSLWSKSEDQGSPSAQDSYLCLHTSNFALPIHVRYQVNPHTHTRTHQYTCPSHTYINYMSGYVYIALYCNYIASLFHSPFEFWTHYILAAWVAYLIILPTYLKSRSTCSTFICLCVHLYF